MKKKLTKTGLIFTLAIIYVNLINAQDYLITFTGSGQSNNVEIVEVKNITQQNSVTLNGADTLHLVYVVGINPIDQENAGIKVYPNPTMHSSRVEFYNSEAGNVTMEIIDISGKTLSALPIKLSIGMQVFEIKGMGTGIYLLKVTTETTLYQQRLIIYSESFGTPQINYIGSYDHGSVPLEMKSTKSIVQMQYNNGDKLVIKGISGDYSHTKSLIPTESQNIDFEFIECVDGDGNHYGVVTIGEQVWMAENLKTTHYRNGTPIEYPGSDNSAWQNNSSGAYAWHGNDINWKDKYGALYNWYATINNNELCPPGWQVPSDARWMELALYALTGNTLKSCRQENSPLGGDCSTAVHPRWDSHETIYGVDEFGFSAFPGGHRYAFGSYDVIGNLGLWWSSTESSTTGAWCWGMNYDDSNVARGALNKGYGFSVRCLRD